MTQENMHYGYAFRLPATPAGENLVNVLRKYLNTDSFKLVKRYTGKRPQGTTQFSTRKENAESIRVYLNDSAGVKNARRDFHNYLTEKQTQANNNTILNHADSMEELKDAHRKEMRMTAEELQALNLVLAEQIEKNIELAKTLENAHIQLELYNEILQHSEKYRGIYKLVQRIKQSGRRVEIKYLDVSKDSLSILEKEILNMADNGEIDLDSLSQ